MRITLFSALFLVLFMSSVIAVTSAPVLQCKNVVEDSKKIEITSDSDSLTVSIQKGAVLFSSDKPFTVYGIGGLVTAQSVVLKDNEIWSDNKNLGSVDTSIFGTPLFSIGKDILYTYAQDKSSMSFLLGHNYLQVSNQKILFCETEQVPQCADNLDNEGDGSVDYFGGCDTNADGKIDQICGCDNNNDGTIDVVSDPVSCDENQGICVDSESVSSTGCDGTYYPYDSACSSQNGNEGDLSCLSRYKDVIEGDCTSFFPGEQQGQCTKSHTMDIDAYCRMTYDEEDQSCLNNEDCKKDEFCDGQYNVCVSVSSLAQEGGGQSCGDDTVCSSGFTCYNSICVPKIKQSYLTPDNPLFAVPQNILDTVESAVTKETPEGALQNLARLHRDDLMLEKRFEQGYVSSDRYMKLREKQLTKEYKGVDHAAQVIGKQLEIDTNNPGLKQALLRLQSFKMKDDRTLSTLQNSEAKKQIQDISLNVEEKISAPDFKSRSVMERKNINQRNVGIEWERSIDTKDVSAALKPHRALRLPSIAERDSSGTLGERSAGQSLTLPPRPQDQQRNVPTESASSQPLPSREPLPPRELPPQGLPPLLMTGAVVKNLFTKVYAFFDSFL